ncbi:WD40-repeat-containing domain protein [Kickxella alabastrina]|uniref:WD40-repeat-containing domain protein n=1 Tax=Kickxella alabastrina TaxID=61397 RepID=UPI00221F4DA6|nr:WD40-repeat-containing domain protein [Kickxella alabastrina]KAI7827722.1 WD40-repeat-containing domain protein [Kickxella alabastrina]
MSSRNQYADPDADEANHTFDDDIEETYVEEDDVADVVGDGDDDDGEMNQEEGSSQQRGEVLLEDDSIQGFFLHKEPVFSKNENLAVSGGGDDRAYLWRLDTGDTVAELDKHDDSVSSVKFSNDGTLVASGGMDGKVNVYTVDNAKRCGPDEIQWINWHPKGNVLLAGSNDASLWMWSLPTGDFMNVFNGHAAPITCGQFTNSGRNIVSGSEDGSLIIWDPKTAAIVTQFTSDNERFHQEAITSLAIAKDDQTILTGSTDSTAKLVHINGTAVGLCSILPLAATGSVDGSLSIWDINSMRLRTTLKHDDSVNRIMWHEDSPLLTSVSMDCTVRTWDTRTGECVRTSRGHQEGIMEFAMTKDGKIAVTASDDGCCLVFSQQK